MNLASRNFRVRNGLRGGFAAVAVLALGCTEQTVTEPRVPVGPTIPGTLAEVSCTVTVATGRMACVPAGPTAAGAVSVSGARFSLTSAAPLVPSIIMGGQNTYVTLANTVPVYSGGVFSTTVTITNLIPQPIGTIDGITPAPEGIRIFFSTAPHVTDGTGTVTVANADGTDEFTATNQPYFKYEEMLADNATSAGKLWEFNVPGSVDEFKFSMLVWAPVEHPDGYIEVTPASATLDLGDPGTQTQDFDATLFDAVGTAQPAPSFTWTSSTPGIASVDNNGLATAIKSGVVTITADDGTLEGEATLTVVQPVDLDESTVDASPASIIANGTSTSTITVTLRDAEGNALTESAGTVTLDLTGTGSLSGVTDAGNGTYTATLTAPTSLGSANITAELDGDALTDDADVTFIAGAPASYTVNSTDDTPDAGATVTLTAQVKDANGNNVPGVRTVTWSATNGGSFTGGNTSDTDGNGVATKDFTVAAAGGTVHVVTAATGAAEGTVTLTLNNVAPDPDDQAYDALGNVTMNGTGLLNGASDADLGAGTLTTVAESKATAQGGTVTINTDGTFVYRGAVGFTGSDNFTFTAQDPGGAQGTATATISVGDVYWFVDNSYGGANGAGNGTDFRPFTTVSPATGGATTGEIVLVRNAGSPYTDNFTLPAGVLIRGSSGSPVTRTVNGSSVTLLAAGSAPTVGGAAVTSNNSLTSLNLAPTGAAGVSGSSFGTVTLDAVSINATNGAALDLTTGTLTTSNIGSVASSGTAAHGIRLSGVAGSITTTGGAISAGTTAGVSIIGGSVALTHAGSVSQANNAPAVSVTGGHSGGVVVFSGAVGATNGSGLQFDNADASYTFNGVVTLNGGDAGIDVLNGTGGTVNVAHTSSSITNPSGTAVNLSGSNPTFTFAGQISTSASRPVAITGMAGGAAGFTGTITSTGLGIDVSNNSGGTVTFSAGSKSLTTGTAAAVTLATNPGMAINFTNGGLAISTTSGNGFVASGGGTVAVTGSLNSITTGTGTGLSLTSVAGGTGGFTFRHISSNGAVNGVVLGSVTGNGLTVTGDGGGPGSGGIIQNTTGNAIAITTAPSTSLANMTIGGVAGIVGTDVSTLTIGSGVSVNATAGPALNLTNGTLNGTFATLSSAGSATFGIRLSNMAGTAAASAGTISGGATAGVSIDAGTIGFTYAGGISYSAAGAAVSIGGGHATGTVAFTGTNNVTAGTGVQFSNADGTYQFNTAANTTSLNGGDAAVDITGGSGGTFTFGRPGVPTSFAITHANATTRAFVVDGSTPTVAYHGNISKTAGSGGSAWLVDLVNVGGGTITFADGTLSAAVGDGILLNNVDGTVNFNGTTSLSASARYRIGGQSSGAIAFGVNTSHNNPTTNPAFEIVSGNGATNVTYAGSIASTSNTHNKVADIQGVSSGSVTMSGSISATGGAQGISVSNNSGGTITFGNAAQTLTTNTNTAINLSSNTGATIHFTGGNLNLTTTSGGAFLASGGGTVTVQGANNTVNSTGGGTGVSITSTTIGGNGATFKSITSTGGGTNGIVLTSTGGGAFTVTGDGASDGANTTRGRTTAKSGGGIVSVTSGGTINGKSGDGVTLNSTGAVTLRNMNITNNSTDGIDATTVSSVTLDNVLVSGNTNGRGAYFNAVGGGSFQHVEIGNNSTSGGAAASDLWNFDVVESTGTWAVSNSRFNGTAEFGMHVLNNSGTLSYAVTNTTVNGVTNGIGVGVYPQGTSNVTVNFQNDSINNHSARGIQVGSSTTGSSVTNVTINDSDFLNNFVAMDMAHGSTGTFTFSITNNTTRTNVASSAQVININRLGSPTRSNFGLYSGTISGNVIGDAAVANSGSDVGDGINVESNGSGGITRVAILNNTIRSVGQRGIYLAAVDTDVAGAVVPTLEARVQNNNIANFEATALHGIQVLLGALNTDNPTVCLNISSNTVTSPPVHGIRVRTSGLPSSTPTLRLHGWDGVTAPATYFANLNPGVSGNTNYSLGGGTVSSASCTTP